MNRRTDLLSRILRCLCVVLLVAAAPSQAEDAPPFTVTAIPVKSFDLLGVQTKFGPLEWRGGL
ncbi:MAG: hypothetical protein JNM20_01005, partial [Rhizobiales bacterium]|nr:hypothetical protein [Hyphomicrobiales bacterium]